MLLDPLELERRKVTSFPGGTGNPDRQVGLSSAVVLLVISTSHHGDNIVMSSIVWRQCCVADNDNIRRYYGHWL